MTVAKPGGLWGYAKRLWVFLVLLLAIVASPAVSAERIGYYHADIAVQRDGSMVVTETMDVNVEGASIRHGIFRDISPDAAGGIAFVSQADLTVLSVKRDWQPEPWRREQHARGIRIYTGSQERLLTPGFHFFTITYSINRQVRAVDDAQVLNWNVTGNGWSFPIESASATITLPDGIKATNYSAFVGYGDGRDENARIERDKEKIIFSSTRALLKGEGLAFSMSFPKGSLILPPDPQIDVWWWLGRPETLVAAGGTFLVLLYYIFAWNAVGRDPPAGTIPLRWQPPQGLSPALVSYVANFGFSRGKWAAISASLLDLAIKGYLTIEQRTKAFLLSRTDMPLDERLPREQVAIIAAMSQSEQPFLIDRDNGSSVEELGKTVCADIERTYGGQYFNSNLFYIVLGMLISAAVVLVIVSFGDLGFGTGPVIFYTGVCSFVLAVRFGKHFIKMRLLSRHMLWITVLLIGALVAFFIYGGSLSEAVMTFFQSVNVFAVLAIDGIIVLNVLLAMSLARLTPMGRSAMDEIEGLRRYLTLAEQDRHTVPGAPKMSPEHFERLLPYAVALGQEEQWTFNFQGWAAGQRHAEAEYSPIWCHGSHHSTPLARVAFMAAGMSAIIQLALPRSADGGDGGGSDGGGADGGGGW